jgi:hypothetical protein
MLTKKEKRRNLQKYIESRQSGPLHLSLKMGTPYRQRQKKTRKKRPNSITPPKQPPNQRLLPTLNTLQPCNPFLRLIKRNTKTLRTHTRSLLILRSRIRIILLTTPLLDGILTITIPTPGDQDDVFRVKSRDYVVPFGELDDVGIADLAGTRKHVGVDLVQG